MRFLILLLCAIATASPPAAARPAGAILIYSGTTGYRHESIPAGIAAVTAIAKRRGLSVVAREDPTSTLLMTLDPASIGEADVNPNPVAWTRRIGRGRVFYTAMGHTTESYSENFFLKHVAAGLDWILARRRAN